MNERKSLGLVGIIGGLITLGFGLYTGTKSVKSLISILKI